MTRSGDQYRDGLKDGRAVFIDGERVEDVTTHPGFKAAVDSIARVYDIGRDPDVHSKVTFKVESSGIDAHVGYMIPHSAADLAHRREGIKAWAESTLGLMGRSPDHVAGFLSGFASAPTFFDEQYSPNVTKFFEWARDTDQYVSYVIVPPQIDRSKPAHQQADPLLYAGVKKERDDGIVIAGAQMLGTGATISDWVLLSSIVPLGPGDENYANTVVVPLNAPGLKVYSRRSYAQAASSVYDYPLASAYDETDSLVVFDDVFVPWEHVFVYKDINRVRDQWWTTPAHVLGNNQSQIRLWTKLELLLGIARAVAEMNGSINVPPVQGVLGDIAAYTTQIRALVLASEMRASVDDNGVWCPGAEEVHACSVLQVEVYPKVVSLIRELCGGGLIQLPSSRADYQNPEIARDIERYIQSPDHPSQERVKLLKLAWDILGSEFAGRQMQYELFYAGAPHVVKNRVYRSFDFGPATSLVNSALGRYDIDT